jgi:hypothetical protein
VVEEEAEEEEVVVVCMNVGTEAYSPSFLARGILY